MCILDSVEENRDLPPRPRPKHENFTKEETLFLIALMKRHLDNDGLGVPDSIEEMNKRLKSVFDSMKVLWKNAAQRLSDRYKLSFCPERVGRKWETLKEGYQMAQERGKETTKFQFYSEMDHLLGGKSFKKYFRLSSGMQVDLEAQMKEILNSEDGDSVDLPVNGKVFLY